MERYEAILEQLKKAQSRGMETITNRLDFVVQSLEELIQETKSTVQEALPESANEYLPVDEVRTALDSYREEVAAERLRATELEAKLDDLEHMAENAQDGASIELMRALDGARSQSELLKELLPAISDHAARAVVLVLRDGKVSAWSGIGFADGEALRSWQGEAAESAALAKLLKVSQPVRFIPAEDDLFSGWLTDEETPTDILLIPVILRGKLMGTVYIDQLEGQPWNPETAQTLVAQVCWLIDTLQYRATATPILALPVTIGQAVDVIEPEEPQAEDEPPLDESTPPQAESESTQDEAVDEVEVQKEGSTMETEPIADESKAVEIEEPEHDATDLDPSVTMKIDVSGVDYTDSLPEEQDETVTEADVETAPEAEIAEESFEPDTPVETVPESEVVSETFEPEESVEPVLDAPPEKEFEPEAHEEPTEEDATEPPVEAESVSPEPEDVPAVVQMPVEPPEPEEKDEEPEAPTSKFLDEPPPVQPVQPPPDEPEQEISEDEANREEARRFARLLVSEIKLYNEEQVERGREANDIYRRLREDIDRSREMFDKRISADVRADQDYFKDELVRILGDGDPDVLGM